MNSAVFWITICVGLLQIGLGSGVYAEPVNTTDEAPLQLAQRNPPPAPKPPRAPNLKRELPPADALPGTAEPKAVKPPTRRAAPPAPPAPVAEPATPPPSSPTARRDGDTAVVSVPGSEIASDNVPEGQELVNIDFPEPTDIKDIIRAVSLWTGKNVILGRNVNGRVQMISPRKVTKEEAYQAFLSALNLLGLTTVETGKVIKILPVRSAVKGNLKTFLGSSWTPMTDEMITQIVPLKYIDAKEIQSTLARIVSSNSMIAYQPTNTLIISDSGFKVRRILDIIELLDVQGQQNRLEFVPIRYADAKAISTKVQEIFNAKQKGGAKGGSGSSYLSYKIMVDERSNSVVIFGPPRAISDVKNLVRKFDIRIDDPSRQATIHVRPLDYADAKKLASTLSALASGSSNSTRSSVRRPTRRPARPTPTRPGIPSPTASGGPPDVAQFDDNVKITADESSNSLLITGSRAAYEAINSIIRKLDIRKSQVFVESDILDITVDGRFSFGTSIFAGQGSEDSTKIAYTWEAGTIGPLVLSQAQSATGTAGAANQQTLTGAIGAFKDEFTVGVLSGQSVDIPGVASGLSPGALIKLIKADRSSRDLSSPNILTANNETAKLKVGDVLFYTSTEVSGVAGLPSQRVQQEDVSLEMELLPKVSHSNYVTLKIDLVAETGQLNEAGVPAVSTRSMSQMVTVKNGQTVVISGLMKTSESKIFRKIPLLGDIPVLGWLFRNSSIQNKRNNLMIFLTPHIVHGADDLAVIYQRKVDARDEFMEKIYGSDFREDDFYKLLPQKQHGIYRADSFDKLEQRNREKLLSDLRRDMGYSETEIEQIEEQHLNPKEQSKDPIESEDPGEEESKTDAASNEDDDRNEKQTVTTTQVSSEQDFFDEY